MDALKDVPVDPVQDAEFDKAFALLTRLVDVRRADVMLPSGPAAVYTASVVLWLLVYQRLKRGATLESAVKHLIESAPHLCRPTKRVREGRVSASTGAYSDARQALTVEVAEWFAREVSDAIIATANPTCMDRRVFLVDGMTLTLAPEKALQTAFPPASNQYGEGVWPVALIVVAHELESGCATQPEIGPMYGPHAVSETELARACFARLPAHSIMLADANFGIFSVAFAAREAGHSFLFRLTEARFRAYCRRGELVATGPNWKTWSVAWSPSKKECQTNPHLPREAQIPVLIHEVVVHDKLTLRLITDLPFDATQAAAVYRRRLEVETEIGNIKVILDTENIRARSVAMFRKELLTSMVAYNLVVQFRREAARLAQLPPKRLSFTRIWTTYRTFLLNRISVDPTEWRLRFRTALHYAMRDVLPNRPGRNYERCVYPRRPKSNQFKKRTKPRPPDD